MKPRPTKHDTRPRTPPPEDFTLQQLAAEFGIAYRKWCKRRGFSDHSDFDFRTQISAGITGGLAERRAGRQRKSDPQAAAIATALDACPETLPESLLRGRESQEGKLP